MLSRHPSVAVPPTCLAAPGRTRACSRFQSMKEAVAVVILRHTVYRRDHHLPQITRALPRGLLVTPGVPPPTTLAN